ncbi:MAG: GGDEF domain-containing protein [Ignavibacteriae bacterium]|nr:GGDEF domain-containing protein [Ignavibacteriota bacterium]
MNRPGISVILMILISLPVIQDSSACYCQHQTEFKFEQITNEQGLSQNTVTCLLQDSKGFIWIGTQDGLNKFDGYDFTIYRNNPLDSHSLSQNYINCLFEDSKNKIWIGTNRGGLERYDPLTNEFTHFIHDSSDSHSLTGNEVITIFEDHSGTIWIGTTEGINKFEPLTNQFTRYLHDDNEPKSLSSNIVTTLFEDVEHNLWLGTTNGGLNKLNPARNSFEHFVHDELNPQSISDNSTSSIVEDHLNNLWIGTRSNGLNRFDRKTKTFTHYYSDSKNPHSLSYDEILDLEITTYPDSPLLWIGTLGGINIYDFKNKEIVRVGMTQELPLSIKNVKILSILEDRSSGLWFGTLGDGILKIDLTKKKFLHVANIPGNENSLLNNYIWSIFKDKSGALWIGTNDGLDEFDESTKQYKHYRQDKNNPNSLSGNQIQVIREDRYGMLWLGTDVSGLMMFDKHKNQFHHYVNDVLDSNSLSNNRITSLYEDHNGVLWIGTWGGLAILDSGRKIFRQYHHNPNDANSLSHEIITSISEDHTGTLWISTGGGLHSLDSSRNNFRRYMHNPKNPNSLINNWVNCVHESRLEIDGKRPLWIGTYGSGFDKFDPATETFIHFTESDGLPNNVVYAILEDEHGYLWLSTNLGVSRFDPRNNTFKNYDGTDGLQSNEFNAGASFQSSEGEMFFGGINGFNRFYPSEIRDNPFVPQIVLTSFRKFDKEVKLDTSISEIKTITLNYDENIFSFEFAALNFSRPMKNQYAYMMEGFNREWVYSENKRTATYTNLDPGEYIFRVKGSNNDEIWNEAGTSVKLIILPPYWQTWWFRSLSIITFFSLLYSFYRYRMNRMLEIERTRTRIAQDLHDEVSTTLSGVVYFTQAVRKDSSTSVSPESNRFLSLIQESVSEIQDSMQDIIWSLNIENDNWERILSKFRRFVSDACDSCSIAYDLNIPTSLNIKQPTMEQRKNLWLIFKEIVTNAVKHSQAKILAVSIQTDNSGYLVLQIDDNGIGFDSSLTTERNGLKNIHSRAALLRANLSLDTSPGKGTRWKINFKL